MTRTELIAALKAAEGPSRELDAEVAFTAGWRLAHGCWWTPDQVTKSHKLKDGLMAMSGDPTIEVPAFTASIDAALTLVPKGWRIYTADFSIKGRTRWSLLGPCKTWITNEDGEQVAGADWYCGGVAKSPALALCIAALEARGHE
jgi:hypothetical protein